MTDDRPPGRAEWDILIDGVVQWEENRTILRAAVQRALDEREQENKRLAAEVEEWKRNYPGGHDDDLSNGPNGRHAPQSMAHGRQVTFK